MIFFIEPFVCQIERVAEYFGGDYGKHFSEDDLRTLSCALERTLLQMQAEILRRMEARIEITEGFSFRSETKYQGGLLDALLPRGEAS